MDPLKDFDPQFIKNLSALFGKDEAMEWLTNLPSTIHALESRWGFQFIKILPLSFNFVGLIKLESNQEKAVIKIAPRRGEHIVNEVQVLQCFKSGVPKIIEFDEDLKAFIMEYFEPGIPLKNLIQKGKDNLATKIIASKILELQSKQEQVHSFKHLSELIPDLEHLNNHCDKRLLSKAKALFYDLTSNRSQDVILHGDLHHDNIISHGETWKVIDPHGYIGDPVAEVGAMIRNPLDNFPKDESLKHVLTRRLGILSDELPFDVKHIHAWCFCITMLSAAWDVQDFGDLTNCQLELATILDSMNV